MSESVRVGFVGLGSQGGPMARRIAESGFPTTIWSRRPESVLPYEDTGAGVASTRRELGQRCEVLCVCVVDDAGVDDVLRGDNGAAPAMAPGGVLVIHSTVQPATCRALQADFPLLHVLDAPVSGGGHRAAAGQLAVMVGGDLAVFERCRPVFEAYASPLVHVGPLGSGLVAKVLNNALFTAQMGLAAEAFAIAGQLGIAPATLASVLTNGSGRSYALEVVAQAGHNLAFMAELAGALLAKDATILARLDAPPGELLRVADAALTAMGLPHRR